MNRKQKRSLIEIIVTAGLLILCIVLEKLVLKPTDGFSWQVLCLFLVPYFLIGWRVLRKAGKNIAHGQVFDENFLMTLATVGALAIGEYPEAVFVMLFYRIGELFEEIAVGKSRASISSLMAIRPDSANLERDGTVTEVSPEEVAVGDIIQVRPGEKIPLDGTVLEGTTSLDTVALTGESVPRDATVGDAVISGCVNLTGLIRVQVTKPFGESTVSKILSLVENAGERKSRSEHFVTKFARIYTPVVVISAALLAIIPPLVIDAGSFSVWSNWMYRAISFLVISCPCALVISVPLSFFGGLGGASKQGILVKGSNYMELLSKVDTLVFDKTGTLTQGRFEVSAIHSGSVNEQQLLDLAAAVESFSSHPIAASIVRAHKGHIESDRVTNVREVAGQGLTAEIDGRLVAVGNGRLMEAQGAQWHECHLPGTAVHICRDGEYLGHVVISDVVKPEAAEALRQLKALGVKKTVMLTGDKKDTAEAVRAETGVDEAYSQLMPQDKVTRVEGLLGEGHTVAFVGDGINDAPVLSRADLGIAMGAMGSDAAIEAADVVLMDDHLDRLPKAIAISRRTMRIVHENIVFSLAVKGIVLVLSALGLVNMWVAVFADVGVLILAVLNAMRTLRS